MLPKALAKTGNGSYRYEPVEGWVVRYETPLGPFATLAEAVARVQEADLDPALVIRPALFAVVRGEEVAADCVRLMD